MNRTVFDGSIEIDDRAIGHGGDGGFCESFTDSFGDFSGTDTVREFADRAIWQFDLKHRRLPGPWPAFPHELDPRPLRLTTPVRVVGQTHRPISAGDET